MPNKDYYDANRDKCVRAAVVWNQTNVERRREIAAKYRRSPKGREAAKRYRQGRRAAHRNARVAWRDQEKIDAIYEEASLAGMVVDHVIPLKHPLVCGLHCEDNLMIVSHKYNRAKNNSFVVL